MCLHRFFKHTAAAIAIAPMLGLSLVASLLRFMLAADKTECRRGALSLTSADTFSMVNDSILFLSVVLRQDGFFLEQILEASFSISFTMSSLRCLFMEGFFQAALAICLYVPLTSILPRDSKSTGSFLSASFEGHSTFTVTLTSCLTCTGETGHSTRRTAGVFATGDEVNKTVDFHVSDGTSTLFGLKDSARCFFGVIGGSSPSAPCLFFTDVVSLLFFKLYFLSNSLSISISLSKPDIAVVSI